MISVYDLHEALNYSPLTGEFTWRSGAHRRVAGSVAGTMRKDGYWQIGVLGDRYLAHRLAWMCIYGEAPEREVDHINRNRSDNRAQNLRLVSRNENAQNASHSKNNTSGYRGVTFNRKNRVWIAQIGHEMKSIYLGSFVDRDEAYQTYLQAAANIHTHNSLIQRKAA